MKRMIRIAVCAIVFTVMLTALLLVPPRARGTFYSLEEAYELGLLLKEDLLSIAYYYHRGTDYNETLMGEDYEPIAQEPLKQRTENKIKETILFNLKSEEHSWRAAEMDRISLSGYYGYYEGCYAVREACAYHIHPGVVVDYVTEVGGVNFHITGFHPIEVWVEN